MLVTAARAATGFVAAVVSTLTFHAAMWALLHVLDIPGMGMPPPYPMAPVPPFGVPVIASLCFWAGLYGAVYALLLPRFTWPSWLTGVLLGCIAGLVGLTLVAVLKGRPFAGGWVLLNWVRSMLINGFWGLGVGLILPPLLRRTAVRPGVPV